MVERTKRQIGKASKARGKRAELDLARKLQEFGFEARRTAQYCGKAGTSDVVGVPGVHCECKAVERLNIWEALSQSKRDAEAEGKGDIPAVFFKRNRSGWFVAMPLTDFVKLYKGDVTNE
ncbi:hypothetical protein [uncultured Catenibacterium sp.]|uniref:putative PDDEXK endonuclease n=1 Tax=uncultured Catenibacterium sp. TaxID=286142 RepID=UPI002597B29D|nr:hypothetical protein [uncultured Catenibacterium sp.]